MLFSKRPVTMPTADKAPAGRATPILGPTDHAVLSRPLLPPYPEGIQTIVFGLGCFWGAERLFWTLGEGIWVTAVGYIGGFTPHPTYDEVCTGTTGHTEGVLVAYDPKRISLNTLLTTFWEAHDPTQGYRQGNDVGTQYRSAIFTSTAEQLDTVQRSKAAYEAALRAKGLGPITTEIAAAPTFYFAEAYHQQYLDKVPGGYCGLRGTGVSCPMPTSQSGA